MTRHHTYDVVVVGGGGSGLAAAIEAASLGRKVVLLEKNDFVGGSTIRSIGSISASNTPHQLKLGIKDSPQDHFEDLGKISVSKMKDGDVDNLELRRILVHNVGDTFRWLMSMGLEFLGPNPEPPHRKPRMHNVLPNSKAYGYHLEKRARALGVDIRLERRARRFIIEKERVEGVECETKSGQVEQYVSRGGVILASGDYSANPEIRKLFGNPKMTYIRPTNPTNTGDGHEMVMKLGGEVINGHMMLNRLRFVAPTRRRLVQMIPPWRFFTRIVNLSMQHLPGWLLRPFLMSFLTTVLGVTTELAKCGAIMVNKKGERFCDELGNPVYDLVDQEDQTTYFIFDQDIAKKFSEFPYFISTAPGVAYAYLDDYRRSRPDMYSTAPTVEALARKIGADPAALARAVKERNASPEVSRDHRFPPLLKAPFYALGPVRNCADITDGGLAIDTEFRVLRADKRPIEGLYAVGSAGQGGVILEGHGHHLGWAFTSGRLAGRLVAHRATSEDLVS